MFASWIGPQNIKLYKNLKINGLYSDANQYKILEYWYEMVIIAKQDIKRQLSCEQPGLLLYGTAIYLLVNCSFWLLQTRKAFNLKWHKWGYGQLWDQDPTSGSLYKHFTQTITTND